MKTSTIIPLLTLAGFLGYVCYNPIPEDLADPTPFRLALAGMESISVATRIMALFVPLESIYVQTHRFLMEAAMQAVDLQVVSSNVTARYAIFDGVPVLLYEPRTRDKEALEPGFVYFHGGGYALGSAKMQDPLTRYLSEQLGAVLVSIDYRLAPENVFPAAFDDCLTATKYFISHATDFGVDVDRVVVGGDSAGGHLAAGIVQYVHDDPDLPNFKLQVHFYPWLQFLDFNTPSLQLYEHTFGQRGMPKKGISEFVSAYYRGGLDYSLMRHMVDNRHTSAAFKNSTKYKQRMGHDIIFRKLQEVSAKIQPDPTSSSSSSSISWVSATSLSSPAFRAYYKPPEYFNTGNDTLWEEIRWDFLDPRNLPLFRDDFQGLPKAFVATGDRDHIRDDGIFYVHAMEQDGVDVTWNHYPGAWHGIAGFGPKFNIPTGARMVDDAIRFVKENM